MIDRSILRFALCVLSVAAISELSPARDAALRPTIRAASPQPRPRQAMRAIAIAPDTVTVVAAKVQFQFEATDNTFTTGQGEFDTTHPSTRYLDAPPHTASYFACHLEFLKGYVAAASNGRTVVRIVSLPNVATVANPMGVYAPPTDSKTNRELAQFVDDAWKAADSANPTFTWASLDPAKTFYVIFHAGVGRDVDVSATLGYNPQPQDLPSLYFDFDALHRAFDGAHDTLYGGVAMHDGARIKNSAVIPETETRIIDGKQQVLGTNGILVASFGSFLGLPDLWNTTTGYTAIGRFGLEDISSIFAYRGVFPPLPNAWERMVLGWAMPRVIRPPTHVTLVAQQSATQGDTSIARALINDREYFLFENRQRNPDDRGIDVFVCGDSVETYHFTADVSGFNNNDVSGIAGVVSGCSNYDWGVAGSGILAWHIDENIIDSTIDSNRINASGHPHGVRLMEADGGQQIGVPVNTPFGTFVSEGYDGDAWRVDNQYFSEFPRYSNEFSDTTQPDTRTNAFVSSGLRFTGFDTARSRMGMDMYGTKLLPLVDSYPRNIGEPPGTRPVVVADVDRNGTDEIFMATSKGILAWNADGSSLIPGNDSLAMFADEPGIAVCPSIDTATGTIIAASLNNGVVAVTAWHFTDDNGDHRADTVWRRVLPITAPRTLLPPLVFRSWVCVAADTLIYTIDIPTGKDNSVQRWSDGGTSSAPIAAIASTNDPSDRTSDTLRYPPLAVNIGGNHVITHDWSTQINLDPRSSIAAGQAGIFLVDITGHGVVFEHNGGMVNEYQSKTPSTGFPDSLASLNVVVLSPKKTVMCGTDILDSRTFGYGNVATGPDVVGSSTTPNFPVQFQSPLTPAGVVSPRALLVEDHPAISNNGSCAVVATMDGQLHAINIASGRPEPGFPIAVGSPVLGSPAIGRVGFNYQLYVASSSGKLYAYKSYFNSQGQWNQYLHDAQHTAYLPSPLVIEPPSENFLPGDRAFNWPNPVMDKYTHVRFYVNENARVHVKVTNLANELVMALPDVYALGGIDTEIELHTGEMQSGVYIVRIEAEGEGKTGVAFIKMAVQN